MIKITSRTRSFDILEALHDNNSTYAYLDDPERRYVFWTGLYDKGLGYFRIYVGCNNNTMLGYGDALIGHQDTGRTLINRALSKYIKFDEPIDMSNDFCGQ